MNKVSLVLVAIMMALFMNNAAIAQQEKYQSIFIYNFSKYIKWPDGYNGDKFIIGVLGGSEIGKALETMAAAKKQTNNLTLEVKRIKTIGDIGDCNILFVDDKFCSQLGEITNSLNGKPTLIVTAKSDMAKNGASINFIEEGGKIKFELNQQATEAKGLKIAGSLTSLAIIV